MTSRTRIKMCGLKTPDDALLAADLGVDAIGLVFYSKSPRNIELKAAEKILSVVPSFVTTVGLFYNAPQEEVRSIIKHLTLDTLQFHGNESLDYCESFGQTYIKAAPMLSKIDISAFMAQYSSASSIMLDAMQKDQAGGTGKSFDWSSIPTVLGNEIILAGGLNPENVAKAVKETRCYAVDVSSGIESEKGVKDHEKMRQFVHNVNKIDKELNEK